MIRLVGFKSLVTSSLNLCGALLVRHLTCERCRTERVFSLLTKIEGLIKGSSEPLEQESPDARRNAGVEGAMEYVQAGRAQDSRQLAKAERVSSGTVLP